jgi:hypothetical protein
VLHAEGADLAARGDAGDRVGHVQADALLPHHHRADVLRRRVFDEVVHGIAAEDLDALAPHDLSDGFADLHVRLPPAGFEGRRHRRGPCWPAVIPLGKA